MIQLRPTLVGCKNKVLDKGFSQRSKSLAKAFFNLILDLQLKLEAIKISSLFIVPLLLKEIPKKTKCLFQAQNLLSIQYYEV